MYKNETAVYECNNCIVEARLRQGVRQGCCLSAMLLNCYIQHAMDEVRETINGWPGIKIDMIRYADDIALTAESEDELKETLENLETILGERYNMKISKNKTKVMVVSRKELISKNKLDNVVIKQVKEFTYLGSRITTDGRSSREIQCRIQQGKLAFKKKKNNQKYLNHHQPRS